MYSSSIQRLFHTPAVKSFFFIACLMLAVGIQFRAQLHNGFSMLYGDSYDATIVTTILEHWFNVFRGLSHWSEANYFYPLKNTLGQTDGYFLVGVLYTPFRLLGFDPYLSSELSNITLRCIGFCSFYLLCTRMFRLSHGWALLAGMLFVLSNNLTVHGQRVQLATVSLAPIMGWLLWRTFDALRTDSTRCLLGFGSLSAMFLGAWSITCFYITWFFIYFTVFLLFFAFCLGGRDNRQWIFQQVRRQWLALIVVIVVTAVSLYPLLSVYLTKAAETGMRPYESAFGFTVGWQGIIQTGTENFMFGSLYKGVLMILSPSYVPNGEYYNTGIAPILFAVFCVGVFHIFRTSNSAGQPFNSSQLMWRAMALATITTWLGILRVGDYSAWYLLYTFFPGAKALNVVAAYQLFLSIPVIIIAVRYLQSIGNRTPRALLALMLILLCVEELNHAYIILDRKHELQKVTVAQPPSECSTFFATQWANQETLTPMPAWINNYYAHNVAAMMIAELTNLPTVNGMASFNPKGWDFASPQKPDYEQRVRAFTDSHQLTKVCRLDLETKRWSMAW